EERLQPRRGVGGLLALQSLQGLLELLCARGLAEAGQVRLALRLLGAQALPLAIEIVTLAPQRPAQVLDRASVTQSDLLGVRRGRLVFFDERGGGDGNSPHLRRCR